MSELIIDNEFITAAECFDEETHFEWEAKTTNTDEIITSLITEIRVLKAVLKLIKERKRV